jgi:hypothetical protein
MVTVTPSMGIRCVFAQPEGGPGGVASRRSSQTKPECLRTQKGSEHMIVRSRIGRPFSQGTARRQKQRWFLWAPRWRAGSEATISTLKHPFSMWRATYKGDTGFQRYVGWSIITKFVYVSGPLASCCLRNRDTNLGFEREAKCLQPCWSDHGQD